MTVAAGSKSKSRPVGTASGNSSMSSRRFSDPVSDEGSIGLFDHFSGRRDEGRSARRGFPSALPKRIIGDTFPIRFDEIEESGLGGDLIYRINYPLVVESRLLVEREVIVMRSHFLYNQAGERILSPNEPVLCSIVSIIGNRQRWFPRILRVVPSHAALGPLSMGRALSRASAVSKSPHLRTTQDIWQHRHRVA